MDSGNSSSDGATTTTTTGDLHLPPILQQSSNFFNPSSFSQPLNPNPNPMYNLDTLWSKTSNSDHNPIYDPFHLVDNDDPNPNFGPEKLTVKNPKKRTRASRRAPTTVLTTDTTNFRQMVQEFTGIPAAPFSSSSAYSRRSDYYGGSVAPTQPVRPSAQKIQLQQQQPYLNSLTATSTFHLTPSESHGFTKQPLNLSSLSNLSSNLQNQMFPFQSVSQTNLSQQVNASVRENQRLEATNEFVSSSSASLKRWRGENENLLNFEGVNGDSQNVVVSSTDGDGDGDQRQLPGNADSWSF